MRGRTREDGVEVGETLEADWNAVGQACDAIGCVAVEAVSPHQKEVMGAGSVDVAHPSDLMKEASDLAKAGDEAGCLEKVTQLKKLLGEN